MSTSISSSRLATRPIRFDEELSRHVATHTVVEAINRARDLYHTLHQREKFELLELLMGRRGFAATDPRDIVYVLTAVAPAAGVPINYTKPCEEVYNTAAARIISDRNDYKILACADSSDGYNATETLASWAPDWSHRNYYDNLLLYEISSDIIEFPAVSWGSFQETIDYTLSIHPEGHMLSCRGEKPLDTIRFVSKALDSALMDEISLFASKFKS